MKTKEIVLCGLGISVVFVLTILNIPIASVGYIHLGDIAIFIFAGFLSPISAMLVGGIGSALADVYSGYFNYAIVSLIILGLLGYLISKYQNDKINLALAYVLIVGGYGLWDFIQYQSFGVIGLSILMNSIQVVVSWLGYMLIKERGFISEFKKKF